MILMRRNLIGFEKKPIRCEFECGYGFECEFECECVESQTIS